MFSEEKTFKVKEDVFQIDGIISSAYLGENDAYSNVKGVNLKLYQNESFIYNKPIDLSKLTENDAILTLTCCPKEVGSEDAKVIYVSLIDVNDNSRYITTRIKKDTMANGTASYFYSYVDASFGQEYVGFERRNVGSLVYDGARYTPYINSPTYGENYNFSFTGLIPDVYDPATGWSVKEGAHIRSRLL